MEIFMSYVLPIIMFCLFAFLFFYMGKMDERGDWNNLIKVGKIPNPQEVSRAYEAKQETLKIAEYLRNRVNGISYFLGFCNISEPDFVRDYGMSPERYIYGDETLDTPQEVSDE